MIRAEEGYEGAQQTDDSSLCHYAENLVQVSGCFPFLELARSEDAAELVVLALGMGEAKPCIAL